MTVGFPLRLHPAWSATGLFAGHGLRATAVQKRELYERLAVHFRQLANEIEKVMMDGPE
jgi:hypothetical protein